MLFLQSHKTGLNLREPQSAELDPDTEREHWRYPKRLCLSPKKLLLFPFQPSALSFQLFPPGNKPHKCLQYFRAAKSIILINFQVYSLVDFQKHHPSWMSFGWDVKLAIPCNSDQCLCWASTRSYTWGKYATCWHLFRSFTYSVDPREWQDFAL